MLSDRITTHLVACFGAVLILTFGCGGDDSPTKPVQPPAPTVSSVSVTPSSASLELGGTQQFSASARSSDGGTVSGVTISWSSSKVSVVTINASGLATAVAAGTATIRATGNGISSTPVTITVTDSPVVTITIEPSSQTINIGDMLTFTATALARGGSERDNVGFTWTSSDTSVVKIGTSGVATAVGAGTSMIRAAAEGITSSPVTVTVNEPEPSTPMVARVEVSPSTMTLEVGGTFQFMATALTSDGMTISDVTYTWSSDDTEVATMDETGLVTAIAAGTAMITASADGITSMPVAVVVQDIPPEVASIVVDMSSLMDMPALMLVVGETHQFMAVARTSDGTMIGGVKFEWSSDDTEVATVDMTGLVSAVGAGMADITAMIDEITSEPIMVTVEEPPPVVNSITVSPGSATINRGSTRQFTATARTADNMVVPDVTFSWTSSNTSVATISSNGLARGIGTGSTEITASSGDISGSATLTVREPPPPPTQMVAKIEISPSMASTNEGEPKQFEAKAYDTSNTEVSDASFTWESSNPSVATVDSDGLAMGIRAGSSPTDVTITARAGGRSGTATLTVRPVISRVEVTPATAMIDEGGDTQGFSATAYTSYDVAITGASFTWESGNTGVATISSSGLATGVRSGSTPTDVTITATANGKSDTAMLTVRPVISSIEVAPKTATIDEGGDTQQYSATAHTSYNVAITGVSFAWSSGNTGVATINSSSGLATSVRAGGTQTNVTITARVGVKSGTATLTVRPVISSIEVSPSTASVEEGETKQFNAAAMTSYGTTIQIVSFTWESTNTSVATVSSTGLATALEAGSTPITATAGGESGSATLMVTEPPPPPPMADSVAVSPMMTSIEEGETQQFSATAYDSDNMVISGKTFTWTSSMTSVATINSSGLATGVDAGSTTIRATVDGVSGSATLTVTEPPPPTVNTVTVSPSSPSIEEGATQQFTATAKDSDDMEISGKTFTWTSSDTSKATIRSSGLATGKDAGSTTITATVDGVSGNTTLTVTEPVMLKSRTGTISGWPGYTSAAGSVTFEEVAGGRLRLTITGLNDGGAPDAWLALYTSSRIDWDAGASLPDGARGFGEVTNQSSFTRTFTPSSGETIDSYSHVVLHCRNFRVGIARASLSN